MEEKIRLYNTEELYRYGTGEIIILFLKRQEAEVKRLAKYTEMSQKLANALEEIRLLKAKLYGSSTETAGSLGVDKKGNEQPDNSQDPESICAEGAAVDTEETKERRRPKRTAGCMKKQREGLPVIDVEDTLDEKELKEIFGTGKISELPPAGYDIVRMRPAFCYIEHHNIHVYKSGKKIIRACMTEKLLPHSDISSSTMAYMMNGRFVIHLPANRICQEMARNGYPINRQRIYSLTEYFAFKVFELVIERMKQVMFSTGHIQADETEIVKYENTGQRTLKKGRTIPV